MTMYHMAMPSHMGGNHPPSMHSPLYPTPLIPPHMAHPYPVHSYPSPRPSAPMRVNSNEGAISRPLIIPQQPPAYIPYISIPQPQAPGNPAIHSHSTSVHSHMHPMGYPIPTMMPAQHGLPRMQQGGMVPLPVNSTGVLDADEDLRQEMATLHLGYIETEDSPRKMEQREKLEGLIMEYLSITAHPRKFVFHQVLDVLNRSINNKNDFSAHNAACAFDSLGQYAVNLISQPWRREFREIKLYSGFWVHQVACHLIGAESILALLGYQPKQASMSNSASAAEGHSKAAMTLVLEGVLDPDLISRLALDCMIAYCECQALKKIKDGAREFGLTWKQIYQFRQLHICNVDHTIRHLQFTLQQSLPTSNLSMQSNEDIDLKKEHEPKLPNTTTSRSIASISAANASSPMNSNSNGSSQPRLERSLSADRPNSSTPGLSMENIVSVAESRLNYSTGGSHNPHHQLMSQFTSSGHNSPTAAIVTALSSQELNNVPSSTVLPYSRSLDAVDSGKSLTSHMIPTMSHEQVPTAQLIDLDSSLDSSTSQRQQLIPKVIPQKRNTKMCANSSHRKHLASFPVEPDQCSPFLQPSPDSFRPGTLEEHLEATLTCIKDTNRNSANQGNSSYQGDYSWENWEFVYKGLEEKGYNKDIGDRGNILHQRHNLYTDGIHKNGNNNTKRDNKNRIPITQPLQNLTINNTRERLERPSNSSKSSQSISHIGQDTGNKRNSVYDNLSGFETAPQDSDEYEDKDTSRILNKIKQDKRNNTAKSNNSSLSSRSCSSKGVACANSRPDLHLDTSTSKSSNVNTNSHNGSRVSDKPWSCATCTFLNNKTRTSCEICGKSKTPGPETKPLITGGRQCPQCTLINERDAQECSACGVHLEGSSTYI